MKEKGLILIIMRQELSHINVTVNLARALKKKGYRVIYIGDSRMEKYVMAQGFEYKLIEPDQDFLKNINNQYEKELHQAGKWKKSRLRIRLQNQREKRMNEHLLDKGEKWLKANPPDLVILGQGCIHYAIPFLKHGIPIVGLDTNLAARFCLKSPPAFSKIIPNSRIKGIGYIKNLAAWSKIYLRLWLQKVHQFFKLLYGFGIFSCSQAYTIGKEIKKYNGRLQWWEYNTLRLKVPGIVLCPIEFDFPLVTETRYRCYGGSGVDGKRLQMPFPWSDVDENKPLIYCSVGSHADYCKQRMKLFHSVIDALKQRPHLQVIIQVGDQAERDRLHPLPHNVIITRWVPQLEVLARSHIFITHGGLASVRESIYCGVPMIVFPWGVEQPGNSARIMFHHLGLRGNLKKVTPKIVGRLIDKICNHPSYYQSLEQMQKIFREQENCKKGIDFIEDMISSSRKINHRTESQGPGQESLLDPRSMTGFLKSTSNSRKYEIGIGKINKIFGIGLSRTGTTSLTRALALLGYKAKHFPTSWEEVDQYEALTDITVTRVYKELDALYPSSKFIFTVRDMESWLESCRKYFSLYNIDNIPERLKLRLDVYGTTQFDREKFKNAYERHFNDVMSFFKDRKEDLLVMDIIAGEQWENLCQFLGLAIPLLPFPYLNTTQTFAERVKQEERTSIYI